MKQLTILEILKLDPNTQQQLVIIELSVRIAAIKSLLVKKGIVTDDEIDNEMEQVSITVMDMFKNDPAFAAIKSIAENMAEVAAENLIPEEKTDSAVPTVNDPPVETPSSTTVEAPTKRKLDPRMN